MLNCGGTGVDGADKLTRASLRCLSGSVTVTERLKRLCVSGNQVSGG